MADVPGVFVVDVDQDTAHVGRSAVLGDGEPGGPVEAAVGQHLGHGSPGAPQQDAGPLGTLTRRELEVLLLVARGLSNAQIATRLELSEAGVKSRVNRILTRLGLENRVQAAMLAYESGLLGG